MKSILFVLVAVCIPASLVLCGLKGAGRRISWHLVLAPLLYPLAALGLLLVAYSALVYGVL